MYCLYALASFEFNIICLKTAPVLAETPVIKPGLIEFELLYKRWGSILQKYADYYVKDKETARSIVNDLFVQLWFTKKNPENLSGYLFKAIKNASLNHISSQHKNPVTYIEQTELTLAADLLAQPEDTTLESDKLRFLEKVISRLPEKRQLVFRMYRLEGFSYLEIANLLQISVRTVEDHLSKSMQFIHKESKHLVHQKLTEA